MMLLPLPIRTITVFADAPDADAGALAQAVRERLASAGYTAQSLRLALSPAATPPSAAQAQQLAQQAQEVGFDYVNIGPLPPLVATEAILATETLFCSTLVLPDAPDLLAEAAAAVMQIAHHTPHGFGNLRYCVSAHVAPGSPFFPAGYHAGGPPQVALGVEAAGLALASIQAGGVNAFRDAISAHALRIEAALSSVPAFTGCDWSLAPHPAPERSAAAAVEALSGVPFGAWGTLAAVAQITHAIQTAQARRVGFSGVMLPVLEDATLAQRNRESRFTLRDLLAFSTVCGTGLDTIPLPGNSDPAMIQGIFAEVATLAQRLHKPLTARLMPIPGLRSGELTQFDFAYFVNTVIM
jgi:uncharacterized protein (UPF0210 family)